MLNALFSKSKEVCRFPKPGKYSIEITPNRNLTFEVLEQQDFPPGYESAFDIVACTIIHQIMTALSYTSKGQTVTPKFDCIKCRKIKIIKFTNPGV